MAEATRRFEQLIHEAEVQPFEGWDFSWLAGRMVLTNPSWDFAELARHEFAGAGAALDLGTGGGEFLASLAPLPAFTVATETYAPNVSVARRRLHPLGVDVIQPPDDGELPFGDSSFDLVLDRHEAFDAGEVARVLKPDRVFLTQQVGGEHFAELNDALQAGPYPYRDYTLAVAKATLPAAGLEILNEREEYPSAEFFDVGAIVYYLRATPWQIPGFSVARHRDRLARLHEHIERKGSLRLRTHKILIRARKKSDDRSR